MHSLYMTGFCVWCFGKLKVNTLCIYTEKSIIFLKAHYPMLATAKCKVVKGSIKDITTGMEVYKPPAGKKITRFAIPHHRYVRCHYYTAFFAGSGVVVIRCIIISEKNEICVHQATRESFFD